MDATRTRHRELPARCASVAASLASDDVRAILEDHAGHLWVGTAEGLDLLDRASGISRIIVTTTRDPDSLRDSFIMSLYQDPAGLVWIGTRAGGVSRWNPRSWELGGHRPDWLGGKPVTSFADAPERQGVDRLDGRRADAIRRCERARRRTSTTIVGRRDALGDRRVMSLHLGPPRHAVDRHDDQRAQEADPDRTARHRFPSKAGDPHSSQRRGHPDHLRGARRPDLARHPRWRRQRARSGDAARFASFPYATNASRCDQRGERHRHRRGPRKATSGSARTTAVSISRGRTAPSSRCSGTIRPIPPASPPTPSMRSTSMRTARSGWRPTEAASPVSSGSAAAPDAIRFKPLSREEGLSSDTIYGVLSDAKGRLWLSGNAGLDALRSRQSQAVKTYHREHGLAGRGVRLQRVPSPARWTPVLRRTRAASTSSIRRASRRTRTRRALR